MCLFAFCDFAMGPQYHVELKALNLSTCSFKFIKQICQPFSSHDKSVKNTFYHSLSTKQIGNIFFFFARRWKFYIQCFFSCFIGGDFYLRGGYTTLETQHDRFLVVVRLDH